MKLPAALEWVSPSGNGKLGHWPPVSEAKAIQSWISGEPSVMAAIFSCWRTL